MASNPICVLALAIAASSCSDDDTAGASSSASTGSGECVLSCSLKTSIALEDGSVDEASGLVASADHVGTIYAHNDAGDAARFFAIGSNGDDLGTFNVTNATAVDWEDMARGPCADPSKHCLYIGDIGDNERIRDSYVVYRIEEPASLPGGTQNVSAEAFAFQYPDGSHDAEALLVEPLTGRVYVVTKDSDGGKIFRFPLELSSTTTATLELVGKANVPDVRPAVNGGDIHPTGDAILLRTDTSVWLYQVDPGQSVEGALGSLPCELASTTELQGESIAWRADGNGYFTMSEGEGELIHAFSCL